MDSEAKRYDYRQPALLFVCAFLWLWSIGFFFGGVQVLREKEIEVNERLVTGEAAVPYAFIFLLVPIPVAMLGAFMFLRWKNDRIEIDRYEVRWSDWLGRERVKASLSEVSGLGTGTLASQKRILLRSGEPIAYSQGIRLQDELERRIRQISQGGGTELPTDRPRTVSGFVEMERIFRYRSFNLLITGIMLILMPTAFLIFSKGSMFDEPLSGATFGGLAFLSIFYLLGLALLLSFANERIVVTPSELVRIDRFGREKLRVPLGDVTSVQEVRGSEGDDSMTVTSRSGTITITSSMKGYNELKSLLERLVEIPLLNERSP